MRVTPKMAAAMKGRRMRELAKVGCKSDIFPAKFKGGKCGLSGLPIHVGDPVVFFEDKGLCHVAPMEQEVYRRQRAALPKCGCGAPVDNERAGVCKRCDMICDWYFEALPEDVTRDSTPLRGA